MNTTFKRAASFRLAVLFLIFPFLISCADFAGPVYYTQLVAGEANVLMNRVPIKKVLADKRASDELKKNLRSVVEMREFAIQELDLPATESFTSYMDTGREFANWSLTATPEFSMKPKMWCTPIVGCASHLTFFDEKLAKKYEKKLLSEGYDVSVRGVTSYSTGGYFSDPAMNTLFEVPDYIYASTIFHEMAHEKLRIQNESNFSESFAVFVGETGQYLWVKKHYGDELAKKIVEHDRKSVQFAGIITATWHELRTLYEKNLTPEEMRFLKQEIFQKMKKNYATLKESWGGFAGFDSWFKKPLNNARIDETNDYGNFVPVFRKLFAFSGRNFPYFYQKTEQLAKLSPSERAAEMQNILLDEPTR